MSSMLWHLEVRSEVDVLLHNEAILLERLESEQFTTYNSD
jgi:hypothetical protein